MERREALQKALIALGYTISLPSLISIFEGCNNNVSQTWVPQVFSENQALLVSELAETILPKTKTPGAKDLKLDQFIDRFITQIFSKEEQQRFLAGIDAFEAEAKEVIGKSFGDSSKEERNRLLTKLEQETATTPPSLWGIALQKDPPPLPFYRQAKHLVLLGYFTSEEIAKNVLTYDPVPGKFVADRPLGQPGYTSFE